MLPSLTSIAYPAVALARLRMIGHLDAVDQSRGEGAIDQARGARPLVDKLTKAKRFTVHESAGSEGID
jgi:hypothetical protein